MSKNTVKIINPLHVKFHEWYESSGHIPSGACDIVHEDRCLAGYIAGVEWVQGNLKKISDEACEKEELKKPFIDRRGIFDAVNSYKFTESFLKGIKDSIE